MTHRDGIPELPTVNLDSSDSGARDDAASREPRSWDERRRGAVRTFSVALVLAVGFVLGVVVTDARQTASAEHEVAFFAGASYQGALGNPQGQRAVRVNMPVVNVGTVAGRITDLWVRGFELAEDVNVIAEPHVWTTIRASVVPDCDVRVGHELHLTVQAPDGIHERVVALQAADTGLASVWSERCDARSFFHALRPTGITMVTTDDGTAVTTTPLRTDLVEEIVLHDVHSQTAGLSGIAVDLPPSLEPPRTVALQLRWTVADCATARQASELQVGATIEIPARDIPSTTTTVALPTDALVAMVRFVESQCPPGPT